MARTKNVTIQPVKEPYGKRVSHTWTQQKTEVSNIQLTIPDDAYKIRDLLVKFTNGVLPANFQTVEPVYHNGDHESEDMEKLYHKDSVDLDQYIQTTNERMQRLEQQANLLKQQQNGNKPTQTNDDDLNDDE